MKKYGKFIFTALSLAAIAGGVFYFVKNVINKDSNDEFDDFEDDFEDFDLDDDETVSEPLSDTREYVTLIKTEETCDNEDNITVEDETDELDTKK